jgi:hypothetical protein
MGSALQAELDAGRYSADLLEQRWGCSWGCTPAVVACASTPAGWPPAGPLQAAERGARLPARRLAAAEARLQEQALQLDGVRSRAHSQKQKMRWALDDVITRHTGGARWAGMWACSARLRCGGWCAASIDHLHPHLGICIRAGQEGLLLVRGG